MCTSCVFVLSLLIVVGAASGGDEHGATLRFYHKSFTTYSEVPLERAREVVASAWFNSTNELFVFAHGFTGEPEGPAVKAIISAHLERGTSNVALLNWEYLASQALPGLLNSYLNWAIPNAVKVGTDFAKTLLDLSRSGLVDLNETHLMGHSLGAHLMGVAGNWLAESGARLSRITGLDPAAGLDLKPPLLRLNPKSAVFTAAVHSDPSKYGTMKELAFINFWPNYRAGGPVRQPGCTSDTSDRFSQDDFCSHHRSWKLYIEAMRRPGALLGTHAASFRKWKRYDKEQREANVLDIAVMDLHAKGGNYYFITRETAPYGLGLEGLKPVL